MRQLGPEATQAAFPLGGIGTGNVSIGARGEFRDWELANRPGKRRDNPFSFFAIRVAPEDREPVTRILESRMQPPYHRDQGYRPGDLAGLPRFADSRMRGEYPVLELDLLDDAVPVEVTLTAFTPFVPLNARDSGMPCAVLRYRVRNPGSARVRVSIAGSLGNPVGVGQFADVYGNLSVELRQSNQWRDEPGLRGLWMTADAVPGDLRHGSCALVTTDTAVSAKPRWLTGAWNDGAQLFWDEFTTTGTLAPETVPTLDAEPPEQAGALIGTLAIEHELAPGETRDFEFVLAWHSPNRPRGWGGDIIRNDPYLEETVRNDYAAHYDDAWHVARDLTDRLPALEAATRAFHRALYDSDLPPAVLDAVGSNLAVIRSTTCFVLEGGVFAAWEGSLNAVGSCEGTCTHVWNYAQSLAWLFPGLERSARRTEFLLETREDGRQNFRANRIFGSPAWDFHPAVDGQLGSVLRVYREWLLSGDRAFLVEVWPGMRRALDFAFTEWDADGDFVLDGEQHNTYDIQFVGTTSLANSIFFAALRAGAALAIQVGDRASAERWLDAATLGSERMDALLFNGEYYEQQFVGGDEPRYQYGSGVLSDQLFGQLLAHLVDLGHLFPVEHVRSAVAAVFRYNFRSRIGELASVQRSFALGDEAGLVLCSWPRGGRPRLPFVYSDEVWTGVEYQVAAHLIYEGMVDEGTTIVEAVRARHDGIARNPWNEVAFGSHYARSLASWALMLAYTGQNYDASTGELRFAPARPGGVRAFFSTGSAWGRADIADDVVVLQVDGGVLQVSSLRVRGREFEREDGGVGPAGAGAALRFTAEERMPCPESSSDPRESSPS